MLCVTVAAASRDFQVIMALKETLEMNMWQAFLQGHPFTTTKVCVSKCGGLWGEGEGEGGRREGRGGGEG